MAPSGAEIDSQEPNTWIIPGVLDVQVPLPQIDPQENEIVNNGVYNIVDIDQDPDYEIEPDNPQQQLQEIQSQTKTVKTLKLVKNDTDSENEKTRDITNSLGQIIVNVPTSSVFQPPIITKVAVGGVSSFDSIAPLSDFTYAQGGSTVLNRQVLVQIKYNNNYYSVDVRAFNNSGTADIDNNSYYYIFNFTGSNYYVHFLGLLPGSDQERDLFMTRDNSISDNMRSFLYIHNYYTTFSLPDPI